MIPVEVWNPPTLVSDLFAPSLSALSSHSPSPLPRHSNISPLTLLFRRLSAHLVTLGLSRSRPHLIALSVSHLVPSPHRRRRGPVILPCVHFISGRKLTEDRNQATSLHLLPRVSRVVVVVFLVVV
ncbi:uncharacterized protein DS421_6g184750 [Arachis hypogaea]|nr:uncharacterized protein DS421_6g184750 [Arachis hypogaea]